VAAAALAIPDLAALIFSAYCIGILVSFHLPGCILSGALHFYIAHGEVLEFVNQTVRKSPAIQRRIGDVLEVRLGILDNYKEICRFNPVGQHDTPRRRQFGFGAS
jgi:hypothetical protein